MDRHHFVSRAKAWSAAQSGAPRRFGREPSPYANATVYLSGGVLTLGNGAGKTFSGVIDGSGDFVKQGAGTQTLSGTNTYSGTTAINQGILAMGGSGIPNSSAVGIANTAAISTSPARSTSTDGPTPPVPSAARATSC